MDRLADAYLEYRARDDGNGMPAPNDDDTDSPRGMSLVNIELVDLCERRQATLVPCANHLYPNETLIYHGYLGCVPVYPTVAVSLRTLAVYRQVHRICPRFGIQALCKLLCHLHHTPYRPYLNTQLSIAYDVYLRTLNCINHRLKKALGRDTENWRLLNACPACFYKLEDEPELDFDWLVSIDGNNSLK
ncbi:hypothetical protein HYDPIDRAFT_34448 [Hydnomerulius pinastri MD-312]|uniref:CxC1-like cysteine cluster associated with KDZ transposases domain-containing protein n=1 Tax=Hydnomerulius pinastri MD-312 TaxID=994086 RepID=A0A0C9W670_9AGAM|nr:hypothetical protein HYDPIDRAFT_34448 [Hydnomerulius pinastri MD-312]